MSYYGVKKGKSPHEDRITAILEQWPLIQKAMNETLIPALTSGVPLGDEHMSIASTLQSIARDVEALRRVTHDKEWRRKQAAMRAEALRNPPPPTPLGPPVDTRSEIQTAADEWLEEKCEELNIDPALIMDNEGTETFTLDCSETIQESRSGELDFEVPDRIKEMYNELSETDFDEDLKDFIKGAVGDAFEYPEMDGDGDYECVNTEMDFR